MLPGLAQKIHHAKFLLNENSTTILTGVGVAGTITTAYLSGRASFKAAQIIELERNTLQNGEGDETNGDVRPDVDIPIVTRIKMVWRLYIPPFLVMAGTVASIIGANRIASKKIAALTIASALSERSLKEYKEKVIERWGDKKATEVHDEIAQDRINKNPPTTSEMIITGSGDVLCYDQHTGRYFNSTVEDIKRAENKLNYNLVHFMSASLSEFYDDIGLPATSYSDSVGWNINNHMEVTFSTSMTPDGRPCIAIDFVNPPTLDYHKAAWDG